MKTQEHLDLIKRVQDLMPIVANICKIQEYDDFDYGYMLVEKYWSIEFFKKDKRVSGFSSPDFDIFKEMLLDELKN